MPGYVVEHRAELAARQSEEQREVRRVVVLVRVDVAQLAADDRLDLRQARTPASIRAGPTANCSAYDTPTMFHETLP